MRALPALAGALLLLLLLPDPAWAWGPATHVYLGSGLLDSLHLVPQAVRVPASLHAGWAGAVAGWLVVLGAFAWAGWSRMPEPPPDLVSEQRSPAENAQAGSAPAKPKIALNAEERFFSDPRSAYVDWNFPEPETVPPLLVRGYARPTAEQVALALVDGQKLLAPFAPRSAHGIIAIPVATKTEPGVMLYDVEKRMLIDRRIFKLEQLPESERTWHALDNQKVLYLGEPPALSIEMWADISPPAAGEAAAAPDEPVAEEARETADEP